VALASGASGSLEKRAQESREGAVKLKEMASVFRASTYDAPPRIDLGFRDD